LVFFLSLMPKSNNATHQKNGVIKKNNNLDSVKNMPKVNEIDCSPAFDLSLLCNHKILHLI
jgi:hypothetical protein